MRLFYIPGACSFGPHVALRELGKPFALERVRFVDRATRETIDIMARGARERGYALAYGEDKDFLAINPKGFVPALQLDDGQLLTEGAAIYQFLGDLKPAARFVPPIGTAARAMFAQYLGEIACGVHKTISLAMHVGDDRTRADLLAGIVDVLAGFARRLEGRDYLLDTFTFADVYLFMNWGVAMGVTRQPASKWAGAPAYLDRIRARPSVQAASILEGTQARFLVPAT